MKLTALAPENAWFEDDPSLLGLGASWQVLFLLVSGRVFSAGETLHMYTPRKWGFFKRKLHTLKLTAIAPENQRLVQMKVPSGAP